MAKRKLELDGIRDGCRVKLIFKDDGYGRQWFEKPKDLNVNTLHFEEEAGLLCVHMDSADNQQFREMTPAYPIASGSFAAGRNFCESKGMDLAVLPMQPQVNRYKIEDTPSGSIVTMPQDGYCLMAFGEWSPWREKTSNHDATGKDDQYLKLLDTLARFYNSQITAHVGYLITVSALLFGSTLGLVTSLVLRTAPYPSHDGLLRFGVPALLVALLIVWAFGKFTFSFKYLLGRTQYYIALSQIVFEHMGLTTRGLEWSEPWRKALRERAERVDQGIQRALISLFEARLFASKCMERSRTEPAFKDLISDEKLKFFDIKQHEMELVTSPEHFRSAILGERLGKIGFRMREVVFLAHHDYSSKQAAELLKKAFDC